LQALRRGLECNDERIVQAVTLAPPPLQIFAEWPVVAADAIAFGIWQATYRGDACVRDVENDWAETLWRADNRLGEAGGVRHFLNYYDGEPRERMFAALAVEVKRELACRAWPVQEPEKAVSP
jgi:hypothetical protein